MPKQKRFDRAREDLGNIVALEHINLQVPDQSLATFFYVSVLGLTRDPYVDFGPYNVWLNAGHQQLHLPTGAPQRLRGEIGLALPDLNALSSRLKRFQKRFLNESNDSKDSQFSFESNKQGTEIVVTCPWGNQFRCFGQPANMALGIPYVQLNIEKSKLPGIARFYQTVFRSPIRTTANRVDVTVGIGQTLRFKAARKLPPYDGHHIAIYTPDFSGPYEQIKAAAQISEESDQHQYRFKNLFDPESGEVLFELEHEVRSMHHPMFNRTLINRNANQTFQNYQKGQDAFYPLSSLNPGKGAPS